MLAQGETCQRHCRDFLGRDATLLRHTSQVQWYQMYMGARLAVFHAFFAQVQLSFDRAAPNFEPVLALCTVHLVRHSFLY